MRTKSQCIDPVRVDLGIKLIKTFAALQVGGSAQKAIIREVFGEDKLMRDMTVSDMRLLLNALGVAENQSPNGVGNDAQSSSQAH